MNIDNNLSIANQITTKISKLNLHQTKEYKKNEEKSANDSDFEQEDIGVIDSAQKSPIDIEDIQKYAKYMGENLSIDDINYGIMYGRSVIADYIA